MDASAIFQTLWTGFAISTTMMLFAVAFSLVLKVVKVWNFAQAGFMAMAFYGIFAAFNWMHWPMWVSVLVGLAMTLAASLAMEVFAFDVLRKRKSPALTYFIVTLVVSQFLAYLLAMVFGSEPVSITTKVTSEVEIIGGIAVSHWDLTAVVLAAIMLLLLQQFIVRTRSGQFMLAVANNAELAELYGISSKRAWIVAFAIASVLITAGMYLYGTRSAITPYSPLNIMLFAVVATLLGGTDRIFGCVPAALILSLIQSLSIFVIPSQWQGFIVYVFLFVTILFFPEGFKLQKLKIRGLASKRQSDVGTPTSTS